MTSSRKSIVTFLCRAILMCLWVAGCGPTNGYPPLVGEYLYVANNDGMISEFSINTTTGVLTNVASFTAVPTGCCDASLKLTVHPNNEFIYATDDFENQLLGFDIGDLSGEILVRSGQTSLPAPVKTAITPNGAFLYETLNVNASNPTFGGVSVREYSVNLAPGTQNAPNAQNGVLSSIGSVSSSTVAYGVAVEPTGHYVYVTYPYTQSVAGYHIEADGTLTPNGNLVLTTNMNSSLLNIATSSPAPSTECAYAVDGGLGVLWEMAINTTNGALSLVGAAPLNEGHALDVLVHPNQNFVYSTGFGSSGAITLLRLAKPSNDLSPCTLIPASQISVNSELSNFAIEPMGKFAYLAYEPFSGNRVEEFSIDSSTGLLTQIGQVNTENPPNITSEPISAVTTH